MRYWTNFLVCNKTDRVIMALDHSTLADAVRESVLMTSDEVRVDRVGPLNTSPLFETQTDYDPVIDRVAY